jgi:hypothetical protein
MINRRNFIKDSLIASISLGLLSFMKNTATAAVPGTNYGYWTDILSYARYAPSPHNTQPWKVKLLDEHNAELYYAPGRLLPYTDPRSAFQVMALSLFTEYMDIAASGKGMRVLSEYVTKETPLQDKPGTPQLFSRLRLVKNTEPALFDAELILKRRTSRINYISAPPATGTMEKLSEHCREFGHKFYSSSEQGLIEEILVANCSTLFDDLEDEGGRNEIRKWVRTSREEAQREKDGLWSYCLGFPSKLMRSFFDKHEKYNHGIRRKLISKKYLASVKGTSTVAWIQGSFSTFDDYINTGKLLGRLWLEITKDNLYLHPFGSLITNAGAQQKFLDLTGTRDNDHALWFVFRMGHSDIPPASLRLDIKDILI